MNGRERGSRVSRGAHIAGAAAVLTAAALLYGACSTVNGTGKGAGEQDGSGTRRPERIMVEGVIDFTRSPYREMLRTTPHKGQPVFFASVPRRADRDEEYETGISALAAQAARWKQADITAKFLVKKSNTEMGYLEEVEVSVDRDRQEALRDDIEVLACYSDRGGTYLSGTLPGETHEDLPLSASSPSEKPPWVFTPPEYEGYRTGVGVANRHMYFSDSIRAADEQAMANLARQFDIQVEKKRLDLEQTGGTAFTQYTIQRSNVVLQGVYILDRWISPDGNNYYSLAVVPEEQ
jgi:hypothetical protein